MRIHSLLLLLALLALPAFASADVLMPDAGHDSGTTTAPDGGRSSGGGGCSIAPAGALVPALALAGVAAMLMRRRRR